AYKGVAGARIEVDDPAATTATTEADGRFEVDLSALATKGNDVTLRVSAHHEDMQAEAETPMSELRFTTPTFRPIAGKRRSVGRVSGRTEIRLDGTWRINPSPPEDFAEGPGWSDFRVPGQWTQQGFDIPRDKTVGVATTFAIPSAWAGKRLFLRFEAIHGGAKYWLNGRSLGSSENLFTPVEFDITDAAKPGETNRLTIAMTVDTPSELASFSSNYAFHNLGGIDRSVRVFALPPVHVKGLHWDTPLDLETGDALLALKLALDNATGKAIDGLSVCISLQGLDRWIIPLESMPPGETRIAKDFPVKSPKTWSAEEPHLYTLRVTLLQAGHTIESFERMVGFRSVMAKEGRLLVNGQPVKLAGVNRHEIDPLAGRAATAAHAEEDARLLRDANFNYVRTSHYPPTEEFLDACDRLGLYVECEAPFCWARGGHGEDDPAMAKRFVEVTAAMPEYCRNHPSIIFWSLANESGNGPDGENRLPRNFAETFALCRREDPSRPILFNNEWARDGGVCDVAVLHYPPWPPETCPFVQGDARPIMLDECFPPQTFTFAETLKRNPGLDVVNWSVGQNAPSSFWSHVYASKQVIGAAIWAGIDEEFLMPGGKTLGYGAWGFIDVWRRPKSLAWDAKCLFSPVWIPIRQADRSEDGKTTRIPVENRFSFTDLSELRATWEIGSHKGHCHVEAPPGGKTSVEIPLPKGVSDGSMLALRFFDKSGRLITAHGVTIGHAAPSKPALPEAGAPEWADDGHAIMVSGRNYRFTLDKSTGRIESTTTPLRGFPSLFATRLEERNVFNPGGATYAEFPDKTTRLIKSVTAEKRDHALSLRMETGYTGFDGSVEMRIDADGTIQLSYDYRYIGESMNIGEIGLRLIMDKACQEIQWRRQSEWDVYPEDHIGRPEGRAIAAATSSASSTPPHDRPWRIDANEYGTRDFRATKYNIYEAELRAPNHTALRVDSDGSTDVRACLAPDAVWLHVLQSPTAGAPALPWPLQPPPRKLVTNDSVMGTFAVHLIAAR
ncbi:MAG: hypothetical protein NTU83_13840, partial [Candidatus Hydrogenedentes bacterium]|nr:hypothetical protein [Candidatus Hydrogenedentota bacterium]